VVAWKPISESCSISQKNTIFGQVNGLPLSHSLFNCKTFPYPFPFPALPREKLSVFAFNECHFYRSRRWHLFPLHNFVVQTPETHTSVPSTLVCSLGYQNIYTFLWVNGAQALVLMKLRGSVAGVCCGILQTICNPIEPVYSLMRDQ